MHMRINISRHNTAPLQIDNRISHGCIDTMIRNNLLDFFTLYQNILPAHICRGIQFRISKEDHVGLYFLSAMFSQITIPS